MNTETRNYENERAVLATAIMCDSRQAKLEEKAKKYDKLKEAVEKIRAEIQNLYEYQHEAIPYVDKGEVLEIVDEHLQEVEGI